MDWSLSCINSALDMQEVRWRNEIILFVLQKKWDQEDG